MAPLQFQVVSDINSLYFIHVFQEQVNVMFILNTYIFVGFLFLNLKMHNIST